MDKPNKFELEKKFPTPDERGFSRQEMPGGLEEPEIDNGQEIKTGLIEKEIKDLSESSKRANVTDGNLTIPDKEAEINKSNLNELLANLDEAQIKPDMAADVVEALMNKEDSISP